MPKRHTKPPVKSIENERVSHRPLIKINFPKISPAAWAAIGVIVAAIFASPVLVELIKNSHPKNSSYLPEKTTRISMQDDYYHIGDVEYTLVMQNGQIINKIYFSHRQPQNNPFAKDFLIDVMPSQATLCLTIKSLDPDEKISPTKLFINGNFVEFLNRFSTLETMDEKNIRIPVDISLIHEGKNNMQIFVESTNLDFIGNIDDIEFRNVYLEVLTP